MCSESHHLSWGKNHKKFGQFTFWSSADINCSCNRTKLSQYSCFRLWMKRNRTKQLNRQSFNISEDEHKCLKKFGQFTFWSSADINCSCNRTKLSQYSCFRLWMRRNRTEQRNRQSFNINEDEHKWGWNCRARNSHNDFWPLYDVVFLSRNDIKVFIHSFTQFKSFALKTIETVNKIHLRIPCLP